MRSTPTSTPSHNSRRIIFIGRHDGDGDGMRELGCWIEMEKELEDDKLEDDKLEALGWRLLS